MPVTRKTGQRHRVSDTSGGREMKSPIHLPPINETVPLADGADEFSGFAAGRAGPGRDPMAFSLCRPVLLAAGLPG